MPFTTDSSNLWFTLTEEQRAFLRKDTAQLLEDCEGLQDAQGYIGDVLSDFQEKWPESLPEDDDAAWSRMRNMVSELLADQNV